MRKVMRTLLSRLFLPLAMSTSLAAFFTTRAQGGNTELAVLVATLLTLAVTMTLERVMPFMRRGTGREVTLVLTSRARLYASVSSIRF